MPFMPSELPKHVEPKDGDEHAALLAGAEALDREARDMGAAPFGNLLAARTTMEYAAMLRKLATNHPP